MSNLKELERKVNLLMDYVCSEDSVSKEHILIDLQNLKSEVSAGNSVKILTEDLLTEMGMPSNLLGYHYITEAVCVLFENDYIGRRSVHKEVYPKVSKKFNNVPIHQVERAIRHAISVCFSRGDSDVLFHYFGGTSSSDKGKTTNTEFLFRVTQLVRREVEGA